MSSIYPTVSDDCLEVNRALLNEYILGHLFSVLSVNDIKMCRLVNRMWRDVGKAIFRRKTSVEFSFFDMPDGCPDRKSSFLKQINKMAAVGGYCRENMAQNIPLSSFIFYGTMKFSWLIDFFEDVRNCMKELIIEAEIEHEEKSITVDLNPQISPLLTKLKIYTPTYLKFTLDIDRIPFVKEIDLDHCTIVLRKTEKRIAPFSIYLGESNDYIKDGVKVKFILNEFFDLTHTKEIRLWGEDLILDFRDCTNNQIERIISLVNVDVRNWEICNWKIKEFRIYQVPYLKENLIEIEEFSISDATVDLLKIRKPSLLKKLDCGYGTQITDAHFFFPNLVELTLECENGIRRVPYFTQNRHISKMKLNEQNLDQPTLVHLNDLPTGITELSLTSVKIIGDGVSTYPLKCLHLEYYDTNYLHVIKHFQSEKVLIGDAAIETEDGFGLQWITHILDLHHSHYERLFIGDFDWEFLGPFANFPEFSTLVDKEARFYLFEGRNGRTLTAADANKEYEGLQSSWKHLF